MMHKAWCSIEEVPHYIFKVIHQISRSHELKNLRFESNLSKITRPVAAIKSLRFTLFLNVVVLDYIVTLGTVIAFVQGVGWCRKDECTLIVEIQHFTNASFILITSAFHQAAAAKSNLGCMCHVFTIHCDCLCKRKQYSIFRIWIIFS